MPPAHKAQPQKFVANTTVQKNTHSPQLPPCGNWRLCKQTANTFHYKPQTMSWTQPSRRRKHTLQSSVCTESNRPSHRHKSILIKSHSMLPRHPKTTRHSLRLRHHNYAARNRAKPQATHICPPPECRSWRMEYEAISSKYCHQTQTPTSSLKPQR